MRDYWRSCKISVGVVLVLFAAGAIPQTKPLELLLAPGMYVSFVILRGGIDASWGYLGFAMIFDVLLYGYAVLWVWRLIRWLRAHR